MAGAAVIVVSYHTRKSFHSEKYTQIVDQFPCHSVSIDQSIEP